MNDSGKNVGKRVDDLDHSGVDVEKGLDHGKVFGRARGLAKDYLEGNLHLHVHVRMRHAGCLSQYCAVFTPVRHEGQPDIRKLVRPLWNMGSGELGPVRHDSDSASMHSGSDDVEGMVFVDVVEVFQDPERVVLRPVRSVVRLLALKECPMLTRDITEVSLDPGTPVDNARRVSGVLEPIADRECGGVLWSTEHISLRETPSDLVESRSVVVDNLADSDSQDGVGWNEHFEPYQAMARLGLEIFDSGIGFSSLVFKDQRIERLDFIVCDAHSERRVKRC